jgi:hypothetical protein
MAKTKFWGSSPESANISSIGSASGLGPEILSKQKATNRNLSGDADNFLREFHPAGNNNFMKKLGKIGLTILLPLILILIALYFILVRPALALYDTAKVLKDDGSQISESLRGRDLVALATALDKAQKDLNILKAEKEEKFGWAKNLKLFKANEFYSDSDRFINAGLYAIEALRETSTIITPFAAAAGLKVSSEQQVSKAAGLMEAFQGWISIMPQVADQMDGVILKVSKIGEELAPINVDKYPVRIGKFAVRSNITFIKDTLSQADTYAPDIKKALLIIPRVLAVGTPTKRYMIIMQNDKEIRPTGGFMTNYATFRITNGLLDSDFTSKDMYSIDLTLEIIDRLGYTFPTAPVPYTKLLKVEHWFARDMNYSPDFPTSMDEFMIYYNMAGRINPVEIKPVDGVIAIDTYVIQELLDITGPVTVNGITYSKDNVVLELERVASLALAEQTNRKRVLGDLMQAMLINVFNSDSSIWPKLIDRGIDLSRKKHISINIFDPEAQVLIDSYGIGGRINDSVIGDYLMVVSTNLGGDKTNWFTHKEVTHTLAKEGTRWADTVNIKYTYTQPEGDYAPFVKRFRDWVRVYAPAGSELISTTGSEDESLNLSDQERNKVWFSGYVELGPGETKEMTFKYYLPDNTVSGSTYNLTIQKQAGIDKESYIIVSNGKKQNIELSTDTKITVQL